MTIRGAQSNYVNQCAARWIGGLVKSVNPVRDPLLPYGKLVVGPVIEGLRKSLYCPIFP